LNIRRKEDRRDGERETGRERLEYAQACCPVLAQCRLIIDGLLTQRWILVETSNPEKSWI
jgi:hypothetical protein